jgi:glycosyltransferase involved in cell wall biosynthesis
MSIPASVYIICQNEEKHIRRVLESVKDFEEIIVVDSGSSDATLDIAKEYTEKIFHQEWLGFAKQKEYAKSLCTSEWVLNLDADEEVTPLLKEEITKTIQDGDCDGLEIRISSQYLGAFNSPLSKFNTRVRFFRKAIGYYPEKMVHESIVIDGKTKQAKGFILEYGVMDLKTHIAKINEYSSLRAQEKAAKGKRSALLKLLFVMPVAFLKAYVLKRGFINGKRGFIAAMNNAYYAFLKEAKLYEYETVEQKNQSEAGL